MCFYIKFEDGRFFLKHPNNSRGEGKATFLCQLSDKQIAACLSDFPSGSAFSAWRHEQTQPRSAPSKLSSIESITLLEARWNVLSLHKVCPQSLPLICLPKASQPPGFSRVTPLIKAFSLSGFHFAGHIGSLWGGRSCWEMSRAFQPM